jgi:hypothetical protein
MDRPSDPAGRFVVFSKKVFSKKTIAMVLTAASFAVTFSLGLVAQDKGGDKKERQWKSQAEYDLFAAAQKDANAQNRLGELDKWKQGFPESEYADVRLQMYLITYQQLNQARQAFDTALTILKDKPDYARGLTAVLYYAQQLKPPQPADLETAEKTAYYVMDNLDKIYAPANKEEGTSDADWAKQKNDMKGYAPQTVIWIIGQRDGKDNAKLIADYTKLLQRDSTLAAASYNLGQAILAQAQAQKKLEDQPVALYHYARAAAYDGPNALPAQTRQQVQASVNKMYTTYHGSSEGFTNLLAAAKTSAFPPADFKIKSTSDLAQEQAAKEAEEMAKNPMVGLWVKVLKENLTKDGGDAYFDMNVKDTLLPGGVNGVSKFKGKIVSMTPATRPKEVDLAIEKAGVADAKLIFEAPLPGKMEPGEELEFEGTAKSFTKEPFMVTFDVDKEKLTGWTGKNTPGKAAPAAKGAAKGATKGATKKQ